MLTLARTALVFLVCLAGVVGATGCTTILGLDEKTLETGPSDASTDHGSDAGKPHADAGTDAPQGCVADDAGYHDPNDKACWETFPVTTAFDPEPWYTGAAFDGRYTYFVNNNNGLVVRYDSHGTFSSEDSWSQYETNNLQNGMPQSYEGIVFDGRYMYFIPNGPNPLFLRYDTTQTFNADAAWTSFEPNTEPVGYQGGTFDGKRYIYFAPGEDESSAGLGDGSGLVERYDTTGSFTSKTSWATFDTSKLGSAAYVGSASGFHGAVFDGRYVYLAPNDLTSNVSARYDTQADFGTATSWEIMDLGSLDSQAEGYVSAMFDGHFIYFVPEYESAVILQFDITKSFTLASAWQQYDSAPGAGMIGSADTPMFAAGAYDGRFLYFVPAETVLEGGNGLLQIDDDLKDDFLTEGAWSTFDTTKIHAGSFGSAVYDGRYLYLAPGDATIFARFDTKETASQPKLPGYFGSFF